MKKNPPIHYGKDNNMYRHGFSRTRLEKVYVHMIERCYNPKCSSFGNYGARGITVCDEWKKDNKKFFEWSISHGYEEGLSIDRIDNSKGYSPENCRWITMKEQQNNRTNNVNLTYDGETHTVAEWAAITGINRYCLYTRIKAGWSVEKTLKTPSRAKNPHKERISI